MKHRTVPLEHRAPVGVLGVPEAMQKHPSWKRGRWTMKDGTEIELADMATSHLSNTLRMLLRRQLAKTMGFCDYEQYTRVRQDRTLATLLVKQRGPMAKLLLEEWDRRRTKRWWGEYAYEPPASGLFPLIHPDFYLALADPDCSLDLLCPEDT